MKWTRSFLSLKFQKLLLKYNKMHLYKSYAIQIQNLPFSCYTKYTVSVFISQLTQMWGELIWRDLFWWNCLWKQTHTNITEHFIIVEHLEFKCKHNSCLLHSCHLSLFQALCPSLPFPIAAEHKVYWWIPLQYTNTASTSIASTSDQKVQISIFSDSLQQVIFF